MYIPICYIEVMRILERLRWDMAQKGLVNTGLYIHEFYVGISIDKKKK